MRSDVTLLSTADWDNPFWTNKQHVAVELARRGHKVLYIESLGLRRPSLSSQDLRRILRRIVRALRPPRQVRERLWVWSPVVLPLQKFTAVRRLNRFLLGAGIRFWSRVLALKQDLLWTYNPMTTDFLCVSRFHQVVYHCVDEIKSQPGMPSREIERAEQDLLLRADICFVTAEELGTSRSEVNSNIHYLPNVADFEHFSRARDPATQVPDDIGAIAPPRIGFIGAVSGYKLDFPLIRRMAEMHPEWSILLIGKVGEGDPWTDIGELRALPNVHFLGPRAYGQLPEYLKGFDVAMLPSAINDYTRGMFPMKFFEYLAAGCPVVSTQLSSLGAYSHVAYLAKDHEDFIKAVEQTLQGRCPDLDLRLQAASEQTYERRTEKMMTLIAETVGAHT